MTNYVYFSEHMNDSSFESDDEDERVAKVEAAKVAQTKERIRLKAIDANKKVAAGRSSPLSPVSRKVSRTPRLRALSTDSLLPGPKRSKPVSGIAKIVDLDELAVSGSDSESESDLDASIFFKKKSGGRAGVDKDAKARGDAGKNSKVGGGSGSDKPGGSKNYTIPKNDRTSQVLPQRFWPSDMSADQVDKLSVDQCHRLKKLELEERNLKGGESDLPGVAIAPMALFLPEVTVEGGVHDFVKKIVPASMVHFPIGVADEWWSNVPVEWKPVTGKKYF